MKTLVYNRHDQADTRGHTTYTLMYTVYVLELEPTVAEPQDIINAFQIVWTPSQTKVSMLLWYITQ